jgi:hypothetical protein
MKLLKEAEYMAATGLGPYKEQALWWRPSLRHRCRTSAPLSIDK